jgi:hypothetical protein
VVAGLVSKLDRDACDLAGGAQHAQNATIDDMSCDTVWVEVEGSCKGSTSTGRPVGLRVIHRRIIPPEGTS